jgi:hypothetical protein
MYRSTSIFGHADCLPAFETMQMFNPSRMRPTTTIIHLSPPKRKVVARREATSERDNSRRGGTGRQESGGGKLEGNHGCYVALRGLCYHRLAEK